MSQVQQTVQQTEPAVVPTLGSGSGTTATTFFGPADRAYTITAINWIYATKGGSGATFQLFKDTGTNAPGAGTSILSGGTAVDISSTTAIVANTTTANAGNATAGVLSLAAGDRLSWQLGGTLTALVGVTATVQLIPA
jgi:hypothetical protein